MEVRQWNESERGRHCVSCRMGAYRRTSLLQQSRMKASKCHDHQRVLMAGLASPGVCARMYNANEIRDPRVAHRSRDKSAHASALGMPISRTWDGRYVRIADEGTLPKYTRTA